jgi:WD40 repeat protein
MEFQEKWRVQATETILLSGQRLFTLAGHKNSVLECTFQPDDQHLLSVSKDKTIKLWDLTSRRCLSTLRVDSPLLRCAWYPDGERLAVASTPGTRGLYLLRVIQ